MLIFSKRCGKLRVRYFERGTNFAIMLQWKEYFALNFDLFMEITKNYSIELKFWLFKVGKQAKSKTRLFLSIC
jgi:hypothetical protein